MFDIYINTVEVWFSEYELSSSCHRNVKLIGVALLHEEAGDEGIHNLKTIENICQNIHRFISFRNMIRKYITTLRLEGYIMPIRKRIPTNEYTHSHSKKVCIKLTIKYKQKKSQYMYIHNGNVRNMSSFIIRKILQNDAKIYLDINWCNENKKYQNLIQNILFYFFDSI